jgi:putative membrane protein
MIRAIRNLLGRFETRPAPAPEVIVAHAAGESVQCAKRALVGEPSGGEERDATRRTRLANERTYLAWWRTGLTTFAVCLAAGKLVPELSSGATWPLVTIGAAYGIVGMLFIVYGFMRQKRVEAALERGEYAPLGERAGVAFAALGVLLGLGTILVVLVQ